MHRRALSYLVGATTAAIALVVVGCCTTCEEQPADVDHPKSLERGYFAVKYPGNWTVEEDHDGELQFYSIESPGSCLLQIQVFPRAVGARRMVEAQVEALGKLFIGAKRRNFDRWGEYEGAGAELRGQLVGLPGKVTIFAHVDDDMSGFTIIEQCYDEDLPRAQPGFDLIRETFYWPPH